jgi:hypothetical protein
MVVGSTVPPPPPPELAPMTWILSATILSNAVPVGQANLDRPVREEHLRQPAGRIAGLRIWQRNRERAILVRALRRAGRARLDRVELASRQHMPEAVELLGKAERDRPGGVARRSGRRREQVTGSGV